MGSHNFDRKASHPSSSVVPDEPSVAESVFPIHHHGSPTRSDEAAHVLTQFQRVMERFLETQQKVMLSYIVGPVAVATDPVALARFPESARAVSASAIPDEIQAESEYAVEAPPEPQLDVAPTPQRPNGEVQTRDITQTLLLIVSDRTGYPIEMLGLDQDIEADLGIDSIKKVEIMAGFRREVLGNSAAFTEELADRLAGIKTLRGLAEVVSGLMGSRNFPFGQAPLTVAMSAGAGLARE